MIRYDLDKISTKDEAVRFAIWIAYGKKCFYTGEIIDKYSQLELDHIIPRSLKDTEELKQVLKHLGKPQDFNLDSLCNLVPTLRPFNNRKRDLVLELPAMSVALTRAEKMAPTVYKEIEKFRNGAELLRNIAMVKYSISLQKIEEETEAIYDYLTDDIDAFTEVKKTTDDGRFISYYNGTKQVMLDGFCLWHNKIIAQRKFKIVA